MYLALLILLFLVAVITVTLTLRSRRKAIHAQAHHLQSHWDRLLDTVQKLVGYARSSDKPELSKMADTVEVNSQRVRSVSGIVMSKTLKSQVDLMVAELQKGQMKDYEFKRLARCWEDENQWLAEHCQNYVFNVHEFNTTLQTFPASMIARIMKMETVSEMAVCPDPEETN